MVGEIVEVGSAVGAGTEVESGTVVALEEVAEEGTVEADVDCLRGRVGSEHDG